SQSHPSFLLEKRRFSLSWGKEVVEGGKDHYPGDLEVCCWGKRGEEVYRVPTPPHDSPLPGGHTPGSDEGSLTLYELMVLCTTLSNRVERLETELKITKQTYGAAFTKLIKKVKKLEQTIKIVISDDDMVSEDSSKQRKMIEDIDQYAEVILVTPIKVNATRVHTYSRRRRAVCTSSGGASTASRIISTVEETISTAGVSMPVSTAEDNWENIRVRVKADKELTQKLQAEEREKYNEDDRTKMLVDLINQRKNFFTQQRVEAKRNKPMTQAQQRTYMSNYIKNMGSYTLKQLKKLSFEEIKELFNAIMRRIQDFVPMEREGSIQEQPVEEEKELSQANLQQLMFIAPEQGMNVEALQVKYLIIDWEIYTEDSRKYWKIIIIGNYTEVYQFFDDMLKVFDRDDLVQL
nr:hypothetical protein [Tanacetum cinerariifolium]